MDKICAPSWTSVEVKLDDCDWRSRSLNRPSKEQVSMALMVKTLREHPTASI